MKIKAIYKYFFFAFVSLVLNLSCQSGTKTSPLGFLHCEDKRIVDGTGENFLIKGLGPGGWMLQEGYMFHTKVGTQHEIRNMLEDLSDKATTDAFYTDWLNNFFTRKDVELASEWGFNSIRVPIHYNLFTPAIEDEPVPGEITWKEQGFAMLDSLLHWCDDHQMYLIIDLHAAPGGQGLNASISDYDPTKPSLWDSDANQVKMVALWQKIAARYKDEPFIGGYDLLNETNWDFQNDGKHPNGCDCKENAPLLSLYERTITAIREVDDNHIIFVEGNCWANNFNGLHSLMSYDANIVLSFHKYWNLNTLDELARVLNLRDSLNVPLYLGETGENSNTWFTDMVRLVEKHNIGWSQWAYKQMDNDDPFTIVCPEWKAISNYNPRSGENRPSKEDALHAMDAMRYSIKTENCRFNEGVVRAYLLNPYKPQEKAFVSHNIPGLIYATDYDIGPKGLSWSDKDYHAIRSAKLRGNKGGVYRNDGVDVYPCTDRLTNGFKVGSTEWGEWMKYSIQQASPGNYDLTLRVAGPAGKLKIKLDDEWISKSPIATVKTQDNHAWTDIIIRNVQVGAKTKTLTLLIVDGGFDINYMNFEPTKSRK